MKKIITALSLSCILLLAENNKVCVFESSVEFSPIGDTRGNSVLSKKEVVRDCNTTIVTTGKCLKWTYHNEEASIQSEAYNGYDSEDYSDTIGDFFATAGAYDQIEHLWSGFRGHCITGILQDFDWASDPMFWGSMAMDYVMAGGAGSGSLNSIAAKAGGKALSKEAANQAVKEAAKEAGKTLSKEAAKAAVEEAAKNLGKCLIAGTVDLAMTTADYLNDATDDSVPCNPIDEICEVNEEDLSQNDILTMDIVEFNDMRDSFIAQDQDIDKYIQVIDNGSATGIVAYRFKELNETEDITKLNNKDIEKAKEKMKQVRAAIDIGIAALKLGSCIYGYGNASTNQKNAHEDNSQAFNAEDAINLTISVCSKLIPPPAGPLVGAALKVATAFATSYEPVNSCHKKKDAEAQGSRHEQTFKSLKYNLCRPLYDLCTQNWQWGGCSLHSHEYCCYDQLMTKVLVEQIKAELGRDWRNCTGISIRDLNYISFRQCTPEEMTSGIDGAHKYGINWDPQSSFQYKNKCMDMTEFKDYLQDVVGTDIDTSTFNDYWSSLMDKDPI